MAEAESGEDDVVINLQRVRNIPTGVHWFCPCQGADDFEDYDDEHAAAKTTGPSLISDSERHERVQDSKKRARLVFDTFLILAYDGEDIADQREWFKDALGSQLMACDMCVKVYHQGKKRMVDRLLGEYDEDHVSAFVKIFDDMDIERLKTGLLSATKTLAVSVPQGRGAKALSQSDLLALFETLSCEAFLGNPALLNDYFDKPFKLMQAANKLLPGDFVPAMTWFLFDSNQERRFWAMRSWSKIKKELTAADFDWAVRKPLSRAMITASSPIADLDIIQNLWCGLKLIVEKTSKDLITHSLRAMEGVDIYRLALDQFQVDTPALRFILRTVQELLHKSPDDFWDAMGAISPTTVVEQIFNSPHFDKFMTEADENTSFESSALADMLTWTIPFMRSLKDANKPPACRSLVFQLMDRLQADRFPKMAQINCYRVGLQLLAGTLSSFNKDKSTVSSIGRVVISDTIEVACSHIKRIMEIATSTHDDNQSAPLSDSSMHVIRNAISLECKFLQEDHAVLRAKKSLQHGASSYSPKIWNAVICSIDGGNVAVARHALRGIIALVGLEKFKNQYRGISHAEEKGRVEFNSAFGELSMLVSRIMEKLGDFDLPALDKLFQDPESSAAIIAALFSPDDSTYQAGLEVVKNFSEKSGRKEAISHLLGTHFDVTMQSFSWIVRRIAHRETFTSTPRMLKTCGDVLDVLCNAQRGLLRTKRFSNSNELQPLESFWKQQWQALTVIFENLQAWNEQGYDKNTLKDFCRDTMEFADRYFDCYNTFARSIDSIDSDITASTSNIVSQQVREALLSHPKSTLSAMGGWLRLADPFLASTIATLIRKLLGRLGDSEIKVDEEPLLLIQRVSQYKEDGSSNKSAVKTILSRPERAEMARALHEYYARVMPDKLRRLGTVAGLDATLKWDAAEGKSSPSVVDITDEDEFADSEVADEDMLRGTKAAEQTKLQQHSKPVRNNLIRPTSRPVPRLPVTKPNDDSLLFKQKRMQEKEAMKTQNALELARIRKNAALKGVAKMTASEGSGLNGIGVKGKDHAPRESGIMVSSGSESESDNDELGRELFGGVKPAKVSKAIEDYNNSRARDAKAAQKQGPVKKAKQIRSAKDMRARLAPNLTTLHNTILSWDFFHRGDFPPNSERNDYSLVSNKFKTSVEYQNTFQPLLVLETWQGLVKAKEEGNFKVFEIKVANRMTVDSSIEVSTSISVADSKELGIAEADIVLISKGSSPATQELEPHCLARVHSITRKKTATEISYRVGSNNPLMSSLAPGVNLHGVKISSITPVEREYGALVGLQYYDLCDEIVKAKPSPLLDYSNRQMEPIMANYSLNLAQAKAVRSALDNDAFTLIQGPPGSGKTKTIVATVGALLASSVADNGVAISRPSNITGPKRPSAPLPARKKLLVCAPSNAAVDELVMRFKQGVKSQTGDTYELSIIRLGRSDTMNAQVKDVSLEELIDKKLQASNGQSKAPKENDIRKLMTAHQIASQDYIAAREELDHVRSKSGPLAEIQHKLDVLKRQKSVLSTQIDNARDSGNTAARDAEITRRQMQQDILNGANVICATLSGSGHHMFQNLSIEFETVIIDEAAQSIELSALIPLKYGCSKCILVGDPKQLPPTVLSQEAARFQYEQSLFVRMQANHPNDVHLLDTQYRMHPEISLFPSKTFYEGKLVDGPGMLDLRHKPWHTSDVLGPYRFFDVQGLHQSAPRGHSLVNIAEIEVAIQLFQRLTTDYKTFDFKGKVGIITPYKGQLQEMRSRFLQRYGEVVLETVEFNTTDAFQGRESEVIIFSCVRASSGRGVGFLSDIRRMNVGLTRAKSSLWVLGNSVALKQGEFWANLIMDARRRNRYTDGAAVDLMALLKRPTVKPGAQIPVGPKSQNQVKPALQLQTSVPTRPRSVQCSPSSATHPQRMAYSPSTRPSPSISSSDRDVPMKDVSSAGGTLSSSSRSSSIRPSPIDEKSPVPVEALPKRKREPTSSGPMPAVGSDNIPKPLQHDTNPLQRDIKPPQHDMNIPSSSTAAGPVTASNPAAPKKVRKVPAKKETDIFIKPKSKKPRIM